VKIEYIILYFRTDRKAKQLLWVY